MKVQRCAEVHQGSAVGSVDSAAEAVKDEILRSSVSMEEAMDRHVAFCGKFRSAAARVPKKVLQFAGIEDVFTSSRGSTKTLGNFVKATFDCLMKTYGFLTPDLWTEMRFSKSPFQEHTDLLMKPTRQRWGCDRCSGTGARRRYSQSKRWTADSRIKVFPRSD
ncbi:40S ribosomal protein S2-4 [Acorus gramineus]|uniref:40S ribosomal protein S2-4 n=1 Tax=Acorus gramineus TaxID=55184 RepID=A0AAV9AR54_ACOGR|nr:40S ribosomal protein S2-4 [Acorus gramineus]